MSVDVYVGLQFGDEGKAKITDSHTTPDSIVARFNGGPNAGHTVVKGGQTYKLHGIPAGVLTEGAISVIGNGCVIDEAKIIEEIHTLKSLGIDISPSNLKISNRAHLILEKHREADRRSYKGSLGTTGCGIGPAYGDKILRNGTRAGDTRTALTSYITDTAKYLNREIEQGSKHVICEGAQGTYLDVDHGTYPFVTSSNSVAGSACVGLGIGPTKIDDVVGIFKAYVTRVGQGPLNRKIDGIYSDLLVGLGGEVGTTTGRVRDVAWLDLNDLKHAIMLNGCTQLIMTKLDILVKLPQFCVYDNDRCFQFFGGIDLEGINSKVDLPSKVLEFIEFLEDRIGMKIDGIGTGPGKGDFVSLVESNIVAKV